MPYTRRNPAMTVLYCRLGLIFLLDVFVYSLVSMYSLLMYSSNFIKFFFVKEA
jgi:hypothetical protein